MPKNQSDTAADYKKLILSSLKEKNKSLIIGLSVVLLTLIIAFSLSFSFFTSLFSTKTGRDKKTEKPEVISAKKSVKTYTVKEGDQLFLIAQQFYGSGLNMEDIMKANNLTNPDLIEVGQKLIIPDVKPRYPTTGQITEAAAKTEKVTLKQEKYVVKEGDSLAKIALQAYGDSYAWKKLAEANNLINPDILEVGKTLIIPR